MTLPFTALRRLDCVPEPTKPAALAKYSCVDQALYPLVAGSKKVRDAGLVVLPPAGELPSADQRAAGGAVPVNLWSTVATVVIGCGLAVMDWVINLF